MATNIGRLLTAMLTPFTPDRAIDYGKAGELVALLCEDGSDGVVVFGTTGEAPTLSDEEKIELVRVVRAAIPGKNVVAGVGTNSTHHSVEMGEKAMQAGADALLAVVPYYNKPPQEGLYLHFRAIAEAVAVPLILYNVPSRTVTNMLPDTTLRLSEIDNIIGVKEASGSLDQMSLICAAKPERFRVWAGDDGIALPLLAVGGYGVICVVSHIAGGSMKRLIEAYLAGDVDSARSIHLRLAPVINALMTTAANPVPVKMVVNELGFKAGPFRLPLTPLTDEELAKVMKTVRAAGDVITSKPGVKVA